MKFQPHPDELGGLLALAQADGPPIYARVHVKVGESGEAWPVVERVHGGWQSGGHHYPDADVLDVASLPLVDPRRLVVVGGWLCEDTGRHDCVGGGAEVLGAHELGCGLAQVMPLEDVPGLGREINTPEVRQAIADAIAEHNGQPDRLTGAIYVILDRASAGAPLDPA